MITYVVANRKGGVGKSTTAAALFNWLEKHGKKTLLIDLDSQCNVSYGFGFDVDADPNMKTVANVFAGEASLEDVLKNSHTLYGKVVPGADNLVDFDNGSEQIKVNLRNALATVKDDFDYCVLDAPPSLGRLTVAAMLAADYVIIPVLADIFSVQGLNKMVQILDSVKEYNKSIKVSGILLTRNNERLVLTKALTDMLTEMAEQMGSKVFETSIREGVVVREAMASQVGLFEYDPTMKNNVTKDYDKFVKELLVEVK